MGTGNPFGGSTTLNSSAISAWGLTTEDFPYLCWI
ncbi:hypothetical protein J2X07_000004 [Fictibacillus barbaricus]|uniref:Uncharacterized protein n=1 Tax=Fictibacillus barbaricus TaxID=182136 RepID=A0ABU1TUY5_9BACL|nr:hypothetical protein [Fictibacillus barbaricus]